MLHPDVRCGADILPYKTYKRLNVMELKIKKIKDGLCITGFSLKKGEREVHLTIPDEIDDRMVTRIDHFAFQNCEQLKKVNIPNSVKEIGAFAFEGCVNLVSVTLPYWMSEVSFGTFYRCRNLKMVELPRYCRVVRGGAFEKCDSLRMVIIPEYTRLIESYAFGECYHLKAVIKSTDLTIQHNAFLR